MVGFAALPAQAAIGFAALPAQPALGFAALPQAAQVAIGFAALPAQFAVGLAQPVPPMYRVDEREIMYGPCQPWST